MSADREVPWPRAGGARIEVARDLLTLRRTFRDVLVVPQSGRRHTGGPVWPLFHAQVLARTCWGAVPVPIDGRPRVSGPPPARTLDAGTWCGLVGLHYGHMIADFGMRIVRAAHADPDLPLIFALPAAPGFRPPAHFWQMIDVLGVDRARVVLVGEPLRVGTLHVLPQAERLYGGGPSQAHLDLMDRVVGDKSGVEKDVACVFVSRSRVHRGGQIAGEGYLEEVLRGCGARIFHPQEHPISEQIDVYCRARKLIFSEGSAVHTLQLVGRIGNEVAVLSRRPWRRMAAASIRPRVASLTYLHAVDGLVRGLGPSRRSQRHRGISVLDERKLLREFARIGIDLAPRWDRAAYLGRRDRDLRAWIDRRKGQSPACGEDEFVDIQLASLGVDVRY